jgi:chromosome segregation ATPase
MNKPLSITFVVLWILAGAGFAQERQIPYVDIASAQKTIEALKAENQKLADDNAKLSKEIADLEAQNTQAQQQINKIDPLLASINSKGKELFNVNSTIVDEAMKQKAGEAIKKNNELKTRLEQKRKELQDQIAANQKKIDSNRTTIFINESKISKNNDNIVLLEASIAKTKNQQELLEKYIANVNDFLTKTEQDIGK